MRLFLWTNRGFAGDRMTDRPLLVKGVSLGAVLGFAAVFFLSLPEKGGVLRKTGLSLMFGGALSNVTLITMVAGAAKSKKNFPKTIGFDEISECRRGKSLPGQPIIVVRLKNGAVFSFLSGFYQTQKVDQSYAIIQSHLQAR